MFGSFSFESNEQFLQDGTLATHANPWLRQLLDDVNSLRQHGDSAHVPHQVDGKLQRLFNADVINDFLYVDVSVLRRQTLTVCIPPPGYQCPPASDTQEEPEVLDQHVCSLLKADGSVCDRAFLSQQALRIHQAKTIGGEHGQPDIATQIVVTNQCLFCRRVFANMPSTRPIMNTWAASSRSQPPAAKRAAVGGTVDNQLVMKMLALMAKMNLKHAADIRALQSVAFRTCLVPSSAGAVVAAKAASQAYNEQVQSAGKDHDQGPPHVHVWAALLQNAVDSAIPPQQKEAIDAHMKGATTPQSLVHDVLYCRVATTYDKKHMKVY
ncbi:mocs3, partial [Symbiodinium sp. CCMP2456]